MNFTYGNFPLFSKIEVLSRSLQSTLGGYMLDILLGFVPNNPPSGAVVVENLQMIVSLGGPQQEVGIAYPTPGNGNSFSVRHHRTGHQYDAGIGFRLYLSGSVLEAIEQGRCGGDLSLSLSVHADMTGHAVDEPEPPNAPQNDHWSGHVLLNGGPKRIYGRHPGFHSLSLVIPQSEWIKQLNAAGYQKTILFEVPIFADDSAGVGARHLKEAQEAFWQGRYEDTVARCRDALDDAIPLPEIDQNRLFKTAADGTTRRKMPVEDAFGLAWASLRHITNASHHRNGTHSEFTRPMAQYILGATSLALDLAARERDIFVKRQGPGESGGE